MKINHTKLSNALLRHWMPENDEESIYLYIDGHVRIYHAHKPTSQENLYRAKSFA